MPATKKKAPAHKLGANRKELTRKPRKRDNNFSQSRDIREDRGERQIKTSVNRPMTPRAGRGR